ncbi:MAG: HSP90 family protein [Planctomycetes bacterium]|nr:HSP90 family protein [Planctomycetota bacterium]
MTHRFQINLRGIIDLLSNHLYSRPEVFVRELLQNAVDAITARQHLSSKHSGEITLAVTSPRGKPPTLEVTDNGIGLTEDEIHQFLATIGETSKRDAEGRRTGDYLGQFGIGLLSCFVVSKEIVVVTRSVRDNSPAVEWRGQEDGTYSVRTLDLDIAPGTQVYLSCRAGKEELFRTESIKDLALHYGVLLPYPIRVTNGRASFVVNEEGAPWRRAYSGEKARTQALLRFGKQVFGTAFLDAIPLRSRAGRADGVAFVLPHPANLSARRAHRVYLRNMLLSEEADNLLPEWAFFVKAVVNADDLRPTASREGFYEDERLEAARVELGDCLRDYLIHLAEEESSRFQRFLAVHHLALKALAAQDEECYRLFIDWLPFETTQGRQTVRSLREPSKVVRYVDDVAQYHQMEKVAAAQGFTLVNAGYVYEAELLSRLPEIYPDMEVLQIDSAALAQDFDELALDEQDRIHDFLEAATDALRAFKCRPEVRKFKPADLPALFSAGADARFFRSLEQSKETADPLFQGVLGSLEAGRGNAPQTELIFNFDNPLIQRLTKMRPTSIVRRAIEVLYVQGLLLAHQPLTARELGILSQGLAGLLDPLIVPSEPARPKESEL